MYGYVSKGGGGDGIVVYYLGTQSYKSLPKKTVGFENMKRPK